MSAGDTTHIIPDHVLVLAKRAAFESVAGTGIYHSEDFREGVSLAFDALAEVLTDTGYSIVPLPEPTDTKDYSEGGNGEDYLGWEVQQGPYFVSVYDQGEVQVSYDGNVGEPISVDYARDLGTALLAAAAAAEGEQP